MTTRTQLIFTWCAPIGVLVILVGFWPIAFWIPFSIFVVWLVVMPLALHRAIRESRPEPDDLVTAPN